MSARRPTRGDTSGRVYLDLQRLARKSNRPTDEIIRLYALEALVARITASRHAEHLVLKGGVLLAAFDVRRPTRDVDLAAQQINGEISNVLAVVREIAALVMDDGVEFDAQAATATPIREDSSYAGVLSPRADFCSAVREFGCSDRPPRASMRIALGPSRASSLSLVLSDP